MSAGLVERLRKSAARVPGWPSSRLAVEAADRIESLEAEVARWEQIWTGEPTEAMLRAGAYTMTLDIGEEELVWAKACYQAMLDAAPISAGEGLTDAKAVSIARSVYREQGRPSWLTMGVSPHDLRLIRAGYAAKGNGRSSTA